MYRVVGLLRPDTDFTLDAAESRLREQFPDFTITRNADQIVVSSGGWWIAMALTSGPEVATETQGLVERLAGVEPAEADALIASGRRIEVWTDIPDPFMEHFNDYLKIVEVLKSFTGLLAVDPKEPGVL
jgi:hypothetical protein